MKKAVATVVALAMAVGALLMLGYLTTTKAQQNACVTFQTPVTVCPATASPGGTGGSGGESGRGGAGGSGGSSGGTGGSSGSPAPADALTIVQPLKLSTTAAPRGTTVSGTVVYKNNGTKPVNVQQIVIAGRGPDGSHAAGPYFDFAPTLGSTALSAGASITVTATRTIGSQDPVGRWEAYPTYQDAAGWHDGASQFFIVQTAACVPEADAQFCARVGKQCGAATANDNCGFPRTVSECGPCPAGQQCSSGACQSTGPVPTPKPGTMKIGTNFWYRANWSGEQAYVQTVNWATAYGAGANGLAATNIWNPAWLQEIAPYSALRFMDWGNTNFSGVVQWSQRRLPTDPGNQELYIDGQSQMPDPGMAYEWMIDLANRTHKDMWVCLPAKADADYWMQLALLIKQKLQPGLKVYVEYSNETWNGSFSQFGYVNQQGAAQNLPGSNQYYQGGAYSVWQSLKIFKAFEGVFGAAQMGTTVIRVVSYSGNMDIGSQAFRSVYQSAQWNPGVKIDMLATAPYVGGSLNGSQADIQQAFHKDVIAVIADQIVTMARDAKANGIPALGCYEGGQTLYNNSDKWSANAAIYGEYGFMLDSLQASGISLFMHYTHTGTWSSSSAWGAMNNTGQPASAAHKYRALTDWIHAHPAGP